MAWLSSDRGDRGEYVRLADLMAGPVAGPVENPLQRVVDELVRQYDPGGYRLQCPVAGCGWGRTVPRLELDPEHLAGDSWTVRAEGVPREDVELVLAAHVEQHAAMTETPVPGRDWWLKDSEPVGRYGLELMPPDWSQQEWCDGASCEHPRCLAELAEW